ncbi:hypothetical protein JW890_01160 [candidate division WOR-3 bacterium]|nr:hypothetical protein [candidate division WOR-3 bacterium]
MNIISSLTALICLVLYFAVSGSGGEAVEKELLYGFRVLSGFVVVAGVLRVLGVNINRRKSGGKQSLSGVLFLTSWFLFLVLFSLGSYLKLNSFFLKAFAVPLWTAFASLSGLALCSAVLRSSNLKKWESATALLSAGFFLVVLSFPKGVIEFGIIPGRQISLKDISGMLYEVVFIGGARGLMLAFFCLVFTDRIRVLIGKEKRTDEYTP